MITIKKLMVGGCFLAVIIMMAAHIESWQVRANEYFGDGVMTVVSGRQSSISNGYFVGFIRAWGWYGIYGTAADCRIVPLRSPVGDATTAACAMVFNKKKTVFRGWMDFRGHPRPFCGMKNGDFPKKCYGDYDGKLSFID